MLNFAEFVNKKGGDLEKILSQSESKAEIFNTKTFTLDSIKELALKEKNEKIISLFTKIQTENPFAKDESIKKLMMCTGKVKENKILQMARGLNSLPGFISTILISPVLLGVLIPKLTYYNTQKTYKKQHEQKA